jgi:hypothetical protein
MKKPFPPRSKRSGSDGLRISQEIAAIQAALHKHGLRTRKQPKQAAWKVFTPPPNSPPLPRGAGGVSSLPRGTGGVSSLPRGTGGVSSLLRGTGRVRAETQAYYLLTYQPAPISAWVLHPQNNDPQRHTIETIIQRALKQQPTNFIRKTS